jgi:hypothetical protein
VLQLKEPTFRGESLSAQDRMAEVRGRKIERRHRGIIARATIGRKVQVPQLDYFRECPPGPSWERVLLNSNRGCTQRVSMFRPGTGGEFWYVAGARDNISKSSFEALSDIAGHKVDQSVAAGTLPEEIDAATGRIRW